MVDLNTDHLPQFMDDACMFAEDCGFCKEAINDSYLLQIMMHPETATMCCFDFLATTLIVDAARYATRLDDPSKFSWEKFFVWYSRSINS